MSAAPRDVDAYIAAAPADARGMLEKLRATIRATAPAADEMISYQIPTYKLKGKPLVYFGAAKNHCALYGISGSVRDAYASEIAKYDTSKGTIRFPLDKPAPVALVKKLVKAQLAEKQAAAHDKEKTRGSRK